MPMHTYKCEKCQAVEDKIVKFSEADEGKTFPCTCEKDAIMVRETTPTAAALRFRGQWFGTTGSY